MSPTRRDSLAQELSRVFALLSDSTRLRIFLTLGKGPCNVSTLCRRLGLSQPTVSHHLALLRMGGLVCGERDGKAMLYRTARLPAVMGKAVRGAVRGV